MFKKKKADKQEDEMLTPEEALERAMMELVYSQVFYAELIQRFHREFTTDVPTLAVAPPGNKWSASEIALIVNPHFFMSMTLEEQIDVLKHECHHVINNHFVRFRDLEPEIYDEEEWKNKSTQSKVEDIFNASVLNQAADYAINEYLPNLPDEMMMFDKEGKPICDEKGKPIKGKPCLVKYLKKEIPKAEHKETLEYYYELLQKENEEQEKNGGGQGQGQAGKGDGQMVLDDHSLWHQGTATEEEITQKVKETVNDALENTPERHAGSLPGDVLAAIDALNHVAKDWRQDMQRFVARQMEIKIESSRKRRNRRYGIIYPGYIKEPELHITTALDISGSVSDEELAQFFSELVRIHALGVKIFVIECDTEVRATYDFDPKAPFEVHGRGGTCFNPVFQYLEDNKVETDGLIYLTDGGLWESEDELIRPRKYPVMWAILKQYCKNFPISWGARTEIEVKKKVRR